MIVDNFRCLIPLSFPLPELMECARKRATARSPLPLAGGETRLSRMHLTCIRSVERVRENFAHPGGNTVGVRARGRINRKYTP